MLEINARSFEVNKRSVDYTKTGLICSLCRSQANNARSLHVKSYNVECTLVMMLLFLKLNLWKTLQNHLSYSCTFNCLLIRYRRVPSLLVSRNFGGWFTNFEFYLHSRKHIYFITFFAITICILIAQKSTLNCSVLNLLFFGRGWCLKIFAIEWKKW